MPDTVLVIPCYNEANRLDLNAFSAFTDEYSELQLLFVDDGSTDQTATILQQLLRLNPSQISVLSLGHNVGKAEAVRKGMLHALEREPRFVGYWDADLATPLEPVLEFRKLLIDQEHRLAVIASRVRLLGRQVVRPAIRHYLGRVFATFASLMLGFAVYDTQCGAKLFRASKELEDLFARPFVGKWVFDVELLARIARPYQDAKSSQIEGLLLEYPLQYWRDAPGSKLGPNDMFRSAVDLLRVWMRYY